jgi:DNA-binding MltR family transcriptional regulator
MICLNKLNAFLLNQVNAFCFVPGSLFLVIACPTFLLLLLYDVVHKMMSKSFEDALHFSSFQHAFVHHAIYYNLPKKILLYDVHKMMSKSFEDALHFSSFQHAFVHHAINYNLPKKSSKTYIL